METRVRCILMSNGRCEVRNSELFTETHVNIRSDVVDKSMKSGKMTPDPTGVPVTRWFPGRPRCSQFSESEHIVIVPLENNFQWIQGFLNVFVSKFTEERRQEMRQMLNELPGCKLLFELHQGTTEMSREDSLVPVSLKLKWFLYKEGWLLYRPMNPCLLHVSGWDVDQT